MLVELQVENFALIESLALAIGPGLSVFTGETGAGKSLLVDAVTAALGGRASADFIRTGCDQARVEAVFDCAALPAVRARLAELGLDDGGGIVVLTRELSRSGRHLSRINRRAVPAATVREVAGLLCDLHGQHEHHSLLHPQRPRELVDAYGGGAVAAAREPVAALWRELRDCRRELAELVADGEGAGPAGREPLARRLDLLRYQRDEIDAARLRPGEDAELEATRARLRHVERLRQGVASARRALYESDGDGGPAAIDLCGRAAAELADLARLDPDLRAPAEAAQGAAYQIEEAARALAAYLDRLEADPEALQRVEDRLHQIAELRRKYGRTIADVLAYRAEVAADLQRLERADERAAELRRRAEELERRLEAACRTLSEARREAARRLGQAIAAELELLGLERARLEFVVEPTPAGESGADRVGVFFSANPGDPPRPLLRVASGGELSRIMLALKSVVARLDGVPTLIFDEVDAGVSGRAAQRVAERMARLGGVCQVMAVSHLPQMAGLADAHYRIVKLERGGRTVTEVQRLDDEGRAMELARLLGGARLTELTLRHAAELVRQGAARRAELRGG